MTNRNAKRMNWVFTYIMDIRMKDEKDILLRKWPDYVCMRFLIICSWFQQVLQGADGTQPTLPSYWKDLHTGVYILTDQQNFTPLLKFLKFFTVFCGLFFCRHLSYRKVFSLSYFLIFCCIHGLSITLCALKRPGFYFEPPFGSGCTPLWQPCWLRH